VARWKIIPLASKLEEGMPGIGFPRWRVDLLRVRNGNPGSWNIEWSNEGFIPVTETPVSQVLPEQWRKIG
jgi:protein ImuA